jgi:signal transduction histidine kinase
MGDEYRAAAGAKQLRLVVDVDPELRAVYTDQSRIRQIVANLLSNAIKYTDHGSVVLRAGWNVGDEASGGAYAFISVADTGPGIPPDKREFVFEEFGRLAADQQPGAGLGLAISKRVADALGCRIRVEGETAGATFTLCIPLGGVGSPDDRRVSGDRLTETRGAEPTA